MIYIYIQNILFVFSKSYILLEKLLIIKGKKKKENQERKFQKVYICSVFLLSRFSLYPSACIQYFNYMKYIREIKKIQNLKVIRKSGEIFYVCNVRLIYYNSFLLVPLTIKLITPQK